AVGSWTELLNESVRPADGTQSISIRELAALSATVHSKDERKYRAIEDAIDGSWQAAPTLLECYASTRMSSRHLLGGAALKLCAQPEGANVFDIFVAIKMGNDQSQWRAVVPCEWRSLQPIGEQDIFVQ